ncbi:MAG: RNA polymerase sigma factor [Phycisphaerales bacterium]|nr:MAG: RNA polymerase sigma factor [Phycisphaerales bacterium]
MVDDRKNSSLEPTGNLVELITKAQQGDHDSMSRLAELAEPRLLTYIFRLTLSQDLAEELCQKTLIKMVESLKALQNVERFWNWLLRHAMGEVQHYYRDLKRRREVEAQVLNQEYFKQYVSRDHNDGLDEASRIELSDIIYDAIAQLKLTYRNILVLRCYEELSFAEIGRFLGCKELRARVLFFRAKHALKQHMSRRGFKKDSLLTGLGLFGILTFSGEGAATAATVNAASMNIGVAATIAGSLGTRMGVAVVTTISAIVAGVTSQQLIVCLVVAVVVLLGVGIANLFVALD